MPTLDDLRSAAAQAWSARVGADLPVIHIGSASCGRAAGALETLQAVRTALDELNTPAHIIEVGCIGPCYLEPLLDITLPGQARVSYANVTPQKAKNILTKSLAQTSSLPNLAVGHFGGQAFSQSTGIQPFFDQPMLKPQVRMILKNCGFVDPEDVQSALAAGAYLAFELALQRGSRWVIDEVRASGLRGRGGAGFPTGEKWHLAASVSGSEKYVICNADEGDPGAFMNRSLLESDPHAVLEGMLIAGLAVGASQGIIYVRAEYPLAVQRLTRAISQMHSCGLLGKNILGSGFDFDIRLQEGAGAFVCGEETALIASLEGRRGMPRPRPPFPAERGFRGKPTLINNTETLAIIPAILREGAIWFRQYGTLTNPGTKTFSLVGKARRTGLIEVPLGITLRQVVEEIGGGTRLPFKAVQTGGPLGGCLPAELLDTPITYETMRDAGSIMGSGGLIVMDESTCMVDMALYFTRFARSESCGNCTPCRDGTRILVDILERFTSGEANSADVERLERASHTMIHTSLCGLGQAVPNPVLSSLRYFESEYQAHLQDHFCPAAVCPDLFDYTILAGRCTGCDRCRRVCESNAIQGQPGGRYTLDPSLCVKCRACVQVCPQHAVIGVPVGSHSPAQVAE